MILSRVTYTLQHRRHRCGSSRISCPTVSFPRVDRKLRTVTVNGVPAQSDGLLFQGGEGGDVAPFSAPVGMSGAHFAPASISTDCTEYRVRARLCFRYPCTTVQMMTTFSRSKASETSLLSGISPVPLVACRNQTDSYVQASTLPVQGKPLHQDQQLRWWIW